MLSASTSTKTRGKEQDSFPAFLMFLIQPHVLIIKSERGISMISWINRRFQLSELGTNIRTEVMAGITTFLTMAYIIVVNPLILSDAGMPINGVLFATVLVAGVSSILMGLLANLPIALAPGMGLNAFFTYTLVLGLGLSWQTALAAVFVSGLIFIILSLPGLNIRERIVAAVPHGIRAGVAAGIGLFLALIGLVNAGVVTANPATVVGFAGISLNFWLFLLGLALAAVLLALRIRGALVISIIAVSVVAIINQLTGAYTIPLDLVTIPNQIFSWPSFETFLALDFRGLFTASILGPLFALVFTDMFDSISTFVGVTKAANLTDENGEPKNVGNALLADAIGTAASGLLGTSSATSYIESASGVNEGGRSGLTAVVTGLLFLPFMFVAPLLGLIPSVATAPILVIVGLFMLSTLREVNWSDYGNSVPAFVALVSIPFTYSITTGIVLGFISYTLINLMLGRRIEPVLWILTVLSVAMLLL